MDEVKAIEAVAKALEPLTNDERDRVLAWAQAKFGSSPAPRMAQSDISSPSHSTPEPVAKPEKPATTTNSKSRSTKKTKTVLSMDKDLNLHPSDKQSAREFLESKNPSNVKEKCVAAVYYLGRILNIDKISTSMVYTTFKDLQWKVPSDIRNTLQQAGTAGWLDTKDSDDIKLTVNGENLVEHDLPPTSKAKA